MWGPSCLNPVDVMATLELATLADHLDDDLLQSALAAIKEEVDGPTEMEAEADSMVVEGGLDDDAFVDFRDKLEANDLDADIYVPLEFEEVLTVGDYRVASTYALQLVLESLREDFFIEDDELEEDEYVDMDDEGGDGEYTTSLDSDEADDYYDQDSGDGLEMKDEQLRHIWKRMFKGTKASLETNLCLFVHE